MNDMKKTLDETVGYILRYGGMCRDCADAFGVCPNSGMPCKTDQREAIIRHAIEAIEYGVRHGFLKNPFEHVEILSVPEDDLDTLLKKAQAKFDAMSPEEKTAHRAAQRESFVRGMTTPCEHGQLDFEQCPYCRGQAI